MIPLHPERFVAGGEALARGSDGRVVFVRGGVPGDDVMVEITEQSRDWSRGHVVAVEQPSPDRVVPDCRQRRAGCGGCDWQHVASDTQLPAKLAIVIDALRRTAKLVEPDARMGRSVGRDGYRTTIRVVGDPDGQPSYRMERSNATVPGTGCLVAHPALAELLDRISLTPGLEVTLRTSVATGETTASWDQATGDVRGLPARVATGVDAVVYEQVAGHRFRVSTDSFFQSGPAAAELLVDAVTRAAPELTSARRVLDAYAGVGLFAATVPSLDAHVVAVESSRSAVADCIVNLERRTAQVVQSEFGAWRAAQGTSFDVAIADPARTGLGKPGTRAIVAARAPVVVLVSCDPVSLARDATLLAAAGYRHEFTEVLDLFPDTHHVEAVTRFVLAD